MSFCKNSNYPGTTRDDGKARCSALCVCMLMLLYASLSVSLYASYVPLYRYLQKYDEICAYESPGMWQRWCSQKHACWTVEHCGAPLCMNINTQYSGTPFMLATQLTCRTWLITMRCKASVKFDDFAHMLSSFCTLEHWPARTLSIQIITTVTVDALQSGGACLVG